MKLLEEKILTDGEMLDGGVLKVNNFLNHMIDVELLNEMGKEFARLFKGLGINKLLTVEASGIAIAAITAQYFDGAKVLFAKKYQTRNLDPDTYSAQVMSFTHGREYTIRVSKTFLGKEDRVLVIDDFLANGEAAHGMIDLVRQAGATLCGVGICIEKAFQKGGASLRASGVNLHSLAIVDMSGDTRALKFIEESELEKTQKK